MPATENEPMAVFGPVTNADPARPPLPVAPFEPTGASCDSVSALKRDRIIWQENGLEDHLQYNGVSIGRS